MFYEVKFTMPTLKIKNVDDYKERVKEILFWQIKDTVLIKATGFVSLFQSRSLEDFGFSLFMMIWSLFTLPFVIVYIALCLFELFFDTIFLPLFFVPIIRILPIAITILIWSSTATIGVLAGAALERC